MEARWDSVPLGEVLRPALDPHKVDASRSYPNLGIYSFGRGVFQKPPIEGTNTSASTLYQVRAGQFIYSRLFAFEGAYGLVPRECDGFYVSNEFPTFDCDSQRLDAGFVSWLFKRPTLWRDIAARSTGMGDRRQRIHPEQVLAEIVPLPPLAEQRRIVARIDAFAAKITEARRLREETAKVVTALSASILDSMLPQDAVQRPLGDLVKQGTSISYGVLVPGPEVSDGVPFVRIQDLSIKHPNDQPNKRIAAEVAASYARTRLRGGEVLVGVVGSIGKIGIAPPSWAGANIARAVCRIVPGEGVDARFLAETLSDRRCQNYFRDQTRTLAQPTLNVGQLENTPIRLPSLVDQRRIVAELDALQAKVDAVKRLQAETAAELDALLPALLDRAFKGEL